MLQKVNEEPVKKCPKCSKNTAVRLVSAAGFQLKGSGWYETDFKNKGQSPSKPSATGVDSASTKSTESTKTASGSKQGDND